MDWKLLLDGQVKRNGRLFYRLAFSILRDEEAAEEACQDAITRAMERPTQLKIPGALREWLSMLVRTESYRAGLRRRVELRASVEYLARAARSDHEVTPEFREAVLTAVAELPEKARAVVAMRLLEGMSGNDVAKLLGCKASEVSRQLHSGMEQLRPVLNRWNVLKGER